MRAKTLEGVQEQNYRSHCSFCPLHLLSPFLPKPIPFSPGPILAHHGPLPTSIFLAQIEAQCSNPFSFPFLFFSFLSPTYPSLPPFFSHATSPPCSHPTSYNQSPLPSLFIFFSHSNSHHPTCPSLSHFSSPP